MELDVELGVEREANRASFCVTHWVVPSASGRSPREPPFMRALSDYGPSCSAFKLKMRVDSCSVEHYELTEQFSAGEKPH